MVGVYNSKQKQRYEELVTQSYLTAYYHRIKKMPSLKELLNKTEPKAQSAETLVEKLKAYNASVGGTVY